MFEMQTQSDILTRLKTDLAKTLNGQSSIEGAFNSDMLQANSIEFEQAYAELSLAMEAGFADTSWGEYLTMRAKEFGVIRKAATKAIGKVTITGIVGSEIIAGSLFATTQDVKFYSLKDSTVGTDGTVTIDIQCGTYGTIGNVEIGTIINIPYSIPGVIAVTNMAATYDGFEEETDTELLERYLLKVRTPATSGNKYHYMQWATAVEGVGQAKVLPLWNGPGTVKVIIIDSNNQTASNDLIQKVKGYVEQYRPIGADVTITSPTPKPINISADITGNADLELIKKNINAYFKKGFENKIISLAQIGKIFLDTTTIKDYSNLKLNGKSENITLTDEELPAVGEVVLNVV